MTSVARISAPSLSSALQGCLLGTAAGDSVGLPFENLSRRSVAKLLPGRLEQSLVLGRGLLSDDTEHAVMVALSLAEAGDDVAFFQRRLAARLRWWLAVAPPGVGSATARSILKLWAGFSPSRSGVYSAGNGPAMRSAVLGVVYADRPRLLQGFVRASTRMTHSDPKAFEAALAVAIAASCASRLGACTPQLACDTFVATFLQAMPDAGAMKPELERLQHAVAEHWPLDTFVGELRCEKGVTGYALHTVPAALYAWMLHAGDFRAAVTDIVRCGGDTDSTAAIVGAIVGAGVGPEGIPASWLSDILEWPRSVSWMRALGVELAGRVRKGTARSVTALDKVKELAWLPWTLTRNLTMLAVVVYVLFRRLAATAFRPAPSE